MANRQQFQAGFVNPLARNPHRIDTPAWRAYGAGQATARLINLQTQGQGLKEAFQ